MDEAIRESVLGDESYLNGLMCAVLRVNGVEVRAMIDTCGMGSVIEVNLVSCLELQVARSNIVVSLASNHKVGLEGLAMANLSMGTGCLVCGYANDEI